MDAGFFIPGLSNNSSRILETGSRDPETETKSLETEKGLHRIHGTLGTGSQRMLHSLVPPTRGAGGLVFALVCHCGPHTNPIELRGMDSA